MSLLERIYYLHERIINDRFPNSGDLVREFEISPATAHRDINYLRDRLLAPLAFDQRKNGYYYSEDCFKLPFEDTPRLVLLLGLLRKMAEETGLTGLPELRKLQNRLQELLRTDRRDIDDLIHCEWIETEEVAPEVFSAILSGLLARKQLVIRYRAPGSATSKRTIDPLKLVNYQGRWYCLAWCRLREARRMFHLARITETAMSDETATHRLEPDDDWLTGSFGIFKSNIRDRYQARILFTGTAAEIVRQQRWHPDQEIRETSGGVTLTLPVTDDRELIMKILQFGARAEVLAPHHLREKIAAEITRMRDRYPD